MAKHSRQPRPERIRQTLLLDIEGVQVGVEVLLWTVDALVRIFLGAGGPVARQLAQVSEGGEQRELLAPQLGVLRELVAQLAVLGDQSAGPLRAHVIAGDHGPQRVDVLTRPRRRVRRIARYGRLKVNCRSVRHGVFDDGAIEAQQRRPGVHLGVDAGKDLSHPPRARSPHRGLQLHAFEYGDRRSGFYVLAGHDVDRHHHCRRRSTNHSGLVPGDPVADAVDLDQVAGRAGHRHDVERCSTEPEPALEGAQAVEVDVYESPVHLQSVSAVTDLGHDHPMGLPLVAEFDLAADSVPGPRSTTASGSEKGASLKGLFGVVLIDGNAQQGDVGVASRCRGRADAVHPARVRLTGHDLRAVQQVQQETTCWSCRPGARQWSRVGHNAAGTRPPGGPAPRR